MFSCFETLRLIAGNYTLEKPVDRILCGVKDRFEICRGRGREVVLYRGVVSGKCSASLVMFAQQKRCRLRRRIWSDSARAVSELAADGEVTIYGAGHRE
jgi:hypothetical protein